MTTFYEEVQEIRSRYPEGSRSATDLSAVTFASSRTAARVLACAGADGAAACAGGWRDGACWLPMIHPAIKPNAMPARPKAIKSDFMRQVTSL